MALVAFQSDSSRHSYPHCHVCADRRLSALPLSIFLLSLIAVSPIYAQTPDWTRYTLRMTNPPPTDGSGANATFNQRALDYTKYLACGQENEFLDQVMRDTSHYKEALNFVMAKLWWLKLENGDCSGTFNLIFVDGTEKDFTCLLNPDPDPNDPTKKPFQAKTCRPSVGSIQDFATQMGSTFGPVCENSVDNINTFVVHPATDTIPFATVDSHVSGRCLASEIAVILSGIQRGDSFPGTSGLPCDLSTLGALPLKGVLTKGDWDMQMTALIRILYLDRMNLRDTGNSSILGEFRPPLGYPNDSSLWGYVQDELIVLDGGPGQDSYSWTACGDNEADTGTPQDREDENSPIDSTIDSVGDIASWLCHRLVFLALLIGVAAAIQYVAGLTGLATAVLVAIGAAIFAGQIPETHNGH